MYAPGITYHGDAYLYGGLSSIGNNLGSAIAESSQRHKEAKAMRSMLVDVFHVPSDQADKMNLHDVNAFMTGLPYRAQQQNAANQNALAQMITQGTQPEIPDQGSPLQQPNDPTDVMSQGDRTGAMQALAQPRTLTSQDLVRMMAATHTLTPDVAVKLLKIKDPTEWQDQAPHEMMTSTGAHVIFGKGGQFQVLQDPSLMAERNPDGSLKAIPVKDEDGNIIDYRLPTKGGGTAGAGKPAAAKSLPEGFYTEYNRLKEAITTDQANADKSDEELNALATKGTADQKRKRYQKALATDRQTLQQHFDLYRKQGYASPDVWTDLYGQHNLPLAGTPGKGKTPTGTSRVTVQDKQGKRFTLPADQLDEAKRQGYTEVP